MAMGGGGDRGAVNADINVTPMADVMLVMLIIFMVVTPMLQKGAPVELPRRRIRSIWRKPIRTTPFALGLPAMGNSISARSASSLTIFRRRLLIFCSRDEGDKTVYVKADHRAKYGDVVKVVDAIRTAGVDRVGLLSEKLDEEVRK